MNAYAHSWGALMPGRILFIHTHRITYDLLEINRSESLGLLYLCSFLESKGFDSILFQGEPSKARTFLEHQFEAGPVSMVGFYCDFENQEEVAELSQEITGKYGVPVILGGPQTIGFSAEYLRRSACMAAVLGEGELPLLELLQYLDDSTRDWKTIPGLIFLGCDGTLIRTPPGSMVENLDELPLPAYHRWINRPTRRNKVSVMTGRGCPYSCAFCYEGSLSRKVRLRSVDHVLKEVAEILDHEPEVNYIAFCDDTFTISPKRVRELCRGLSERRKKQEFHWYCEGHVKVLSKHPDLLRTMVDAGLVRLQIGIESGVQKVLDAYGKGITLAEIEQVVQTAYEAGVPQVLGFFITGGPFENAETQNANRAFAEKLIRMAPGMLVLGPSPFMPYPGTRLTDCPHTYGITIEDTEGCTTLADYPVSHTTELSREEIAKYQQELIWHVISVMKELLVKGKIPQERILSCFRLLPLGIDSVWYTAVYREAPFIHGYYTLTARDAVKRSQDIPGHELGDWRPQRIMEMWHDVDFSMDFPRIGKEVLSPLEFELLLHSTGKSTLSQVLERVYGRFSARFPDRETFDKHALSILGRFENRYWLAYAPL